MKAPVLGNVLESNTCVEVRWGWLAYPAGLIVLTMAFLVFTMVESSLSTSRKHNATEASENPSTLRPPAIWKSSILPYMFHGLEDRFLRSREPTRLVPITEMEAVAKMTSARLQQSIDGWKLNGNYHELDKK